MAKLDLLLGHLLDHGNADAVEERLLPELVRVTSELKKRRARRQTTAAASDV